MVEAFHALLANLRLGRRAESSNLFNLSNLRGEPRLNLERSREHPTNLQRPCPSSQSCPAVKSTTSQGSRQSRSAITWLPCLTCFGSGWEPCFSCFGRAAV